MNRSAVAIAPLFVFVACVDPMSAVVEDDPDADQCTTPLAIYGEDDRVDLYDAPDRVANLAAGAAVALVEASAVRVESSHHIYVEAFSLGDELNLCESERFRDQPKAAFCSGILIDDDLVLTAGHCVRDQAQCDKTRFLFNFYYQGPGQLAALNELDLFSCRKLVVQEQSPPAASELLDFAIIQLDRPATPRHRAAPVAGGRLATAVGDALTLIGFPGGVPAKIDDNGRATSIGRADYFTAEVDAFSGSSGSGVLNQDLEVVGVLVRGEQDYVEQCGCRVAASAADDATGEQVSIARRALDDLCASSWPSAPLCGRAASCGDGQCTGAETWSACPTDCPEPECGDGRCGENEAVTCQTDCAGSDSDAPSEWTCNDSWYDAGDGCDCGCGVFDPDCADGSAPVFGCHLAASCDLAGECVNPAPPPSWTCAASAYGSGARCDCDCGAWDPDCYDGGLPSTCGADLACDAATNSCTAAASWTCEPQYYDADDGCDCACGIRDPDCDTPGTTIFGCETGQTCSASGSCQ